MSRETLKDFLNSIGKAGDSIGLTYDQSVKIESGVDLGKDATTGIDLLDLNNENIGLLGDYLSFIVENTGLQEFLRVFLQYGHQNQDKKE